MVETADKLKKEYGEDAVTLEIEDQYLQYA